MNNLKVCFYNAYDKNKPFKKGTILGHVAWALEQKGINCIYGDDKVEPDVYIFAREWHQTRYKKPVIIHAENLVCKEAVEQHCHDRGDAIVFNSEWLRKVYFNTYGSELKNVWVIPPGHQIHNTGSKNRNLSLDEQHIVCISKWWKRPYKRFPLIARSFNCLNRELGYPNAKLHVHGWLKNQPMPYLDKRPRLWKLPKEVRENPNIIYYHKSFHDGKYVEALSRAYIVVHLSAIDSGPQVITEAISQGVPVVITNNMGAVEWVRDIGPKSGIILELDKVTSDFKAIERLISPVFFSLTFRYSFYKFFSPAFLYGFYNLYKLCSDTSNYRKVAYAMKRILDNYSDYQFEPPKKYTMDGIAEQWLEVIKSVVNR